MSGLKLPLFNKSSSDNNNSSCNENEEKNKYYFEIMPIVLQSFVISILEIILACVYKNDITCHSSIYKPFTWLIIDGISNLLYSILLIVVCIGDNVKVSKVESMYNNTSELYVLWIIVGSIMFWRDCRDDLPKHVNNFCYVKFIINYIVIIRNYTIKPIIKSIKYNTDKININNNNNNNNNNTSELRDQTNNSRSYNFLKFWQRT